MAGTRVTQTRKPVSIDSGTKYQIAAQCVDAGTLPDLGLFVYLVTQASDPKNDQIQRVAGVADFTSYGMSRNAAITAGPGYYRSAVMTENYDDIVSANVAALEMSSRINALVNEYDTYLNQFLTPSGGSDVVYPTIDEGTKAALIAAYQSTIAPVTVAEAARDQEQVDCNAKELELSTLQTRLHEAQADLATLLPVQSALAALVPTYAAATAQISAGNTSAKTLVTASSASGPEQASIQGQLTLVDGGISLLVTSNSGLVNDVQTPLGTEIGTLQARVTQLSQDLNAKQLEVNDCHLQLSKAQAAVDQARLTRDQALAAVRAVCTDYTP